MTHKVVGTHTSDLHALFQKYLDTLEDTKYFCNVCDEQHTNAASLREHIRTAKHPEVNQLLTAFEKEYQEHFLTASEEDIADAVRGIVERVIQVTHDDHPDPVKWVMPHHTNSIEPRLLTPSQFNVKERRQYMAWLYMTTLHDSEFNDDISRQIMICFDVRAKDNDPDDEDDKDDKDDEDVEDDEDAEGDERRG